MSQYIEKLWHNSTRVIVTQMYTCIVTGTIRLLLWLRPHPQARDKGIKIVKTNKNNNNGLENKNAVNNAVNDKQTEAAIWTQKNGGSVHWGK